MNQSHEKVYGLSFPTRQRKNEQKLSVSSVFNQESDEEEEREFKRADYSRSTTIAQSKINRKTKSDLEKAFEEDPSIFQYDEVLDEIHDKKSKDVSETTVRKSKYVGKLIKASNERKLERELCAERKAQKDIEKEADLYGDKESFVTSAYREKLTELRALVTKHVEEEQLESVMDIRKQDGLGGFYRYMYDSQGKDNESDPATESSNKQQSTSEKQKPSETDRKSSHVDKRSTKKSSEESADNHDTNTDTQRNMSDNSQSSSRSSGKNRDSSPSVQKTASDRERLASSAPTADDSTQSKNVESRSDPPPKTNVKPGGNSAYASKKGTAHVMLARPRVTTDEELAAARERYLARKAAGIHADIVESD
ncbi:unnamed protein product [Trichobilharzia szidati]|nr:unnamed protein product [Trichobilharzia szidati]